jgi:hypothetical protein
MTYEPNDLDPVTAEFHRDAQKYYEACFGKPSDCYYRNEAILAELDGDYDRYDQFNREDEDSPWPLSVTQLTHSLRGHCTWEILIATGGPAARLLVEIDSDSVIQQATFEYQDWFRPWYAPPSQDHNFLMEWSSLWVINCPYCEFGKQSEVTR